MLSKMPGVHTLPGFQLQKGSSKGFTGGNIVRIRMPQVALHCDVFARQLTAIKSHSPRYKGCTALCANHVKQISGEGRQLFAIPKQGRFATSKCTPRLLTRTALAVCVLPKQVAFRSGAITSANDLVML